MKNTKDKSCAERVQDAFNSRMEDIRTLYDALDQKTEELGPLSEYGLSMDYVAAGTFLDIVGVFQGTQRAGYKRYQLSWGGPSEEFRIYDNDEVEFWYLDWFDGACVSVKGQDAFIIRDITSFITKTEI